MSDKIKTGNKGETLAAEFFVSQGYEIVRRNYRAGRGEIDLIVIKENWLIFVEVKTRASDAYGNPEEFIDFRKINRIYEAAEHFIFAIDWHGHVRFDVISVRLEGEPLVEHFEDALS